MRKLPLLSAGAGSLLMGLIWISLHSKESSPVEATPPSKDPITAQNPNHHECSGDCSHGHAPIIVRREPAPKLIPWQGAEVGQEADLGFEINGMTRAKITMRKTHPDGREAYGFRMSNGDHLFIARKGDVWEGQMMSEKSLRGWTITVTDGEMTINEHNYTDMICSFEKDGEIIGGLPPYQPMDGEEPANEIAAGEVADVAEADIPELESLPGAPYVLYLDFDGELVEGTSWNSQFNDGAAINATEPAGITAADVELIWKRTAEDYRPFNVNVTTIRSVHDAQTRVERRGMVIFTSTEDFYPGAGGVAYVGSFYRTTSDNPSWVFTDNLGSTNKAANSHEAGSHEAGHMLGLRHDAIDPNRSDDYYGGHSNSPIPSWAPIMGVAYGRQVSQWSIGEYTTADNFEDDLAIIASTLGYLPDDHAGTTGGATPATVVSDTISASGLIERNTDFDMFSFSTSGGSVSITANPYESDPNLDILMRLLNSSGGVVAVSDEVSTLSATINASISPGIYYLEISGTGTGDPTTGWSPYGSLGVYSISGTVPSDTVLFSEITSPNVGSISLTEGTGLVLDGLTNGETINWEVTTSPPGGSVQFSSPTTSSTRATFTGTGVYQIRLRTNAGGAEETDVVNVSVEPSGSTPVYPDEAPEIDLGPDRTIYNNVTSLSPIITDDSAPTSRSYEWSVVSGDGQLSDTSIESPDLVFPTPATSQLRLIVGDGTCRSFQEVSLTADYSAVQYLGAGSTATVASSTSSTFSESWKSISYTPSVPSNWISGSLGAGFDASPGNEAKKIFQPLIGSGLDFEFATIPNSIGYLIRVPFTVEDASDLLKLQLDMQHDDGFVAYINGEIVASDNAPASPNWDSNASTDRFDEEALSPLTFSIDLSGGFLVDGANVLTIHGMNWTTKRKNGQPQGVDIDARFIMLPQLSGIISNAPEVTSGFNDAVLVIADPGQRGEDDDPDGDGRGNLYEYGAGTPLDSNDPGYPMVEIPNSSAFDVTIPATPPPDVTYIVEHNPTLSGAWTNIAQKTGAGPWTGTLPTGSAPDGPRTAYEFPTPPGDRGFLRLRMVLVVP